jgi:hypothetical protein
MDEVAVQRNRQFPQVDKVFEGLTVIHFEKFQISLGNGIFEVTKECICPSGKQRIKLIVQCSLLIESLRK